MRSVRKALLQPADSLEILREFRVNVKQVRASGRGQSSVEADAGGYI